MFLFLSIIAISPMTLSLLNSDRFVKLFGFLAIFFVMVFFILPLNIAYYESSVKYIGLPVIFNQSDLIFSLTCLALFSLGFSFLDTYQIFRHRKSSKAPPPRLNYSDNNNSLSRVDIGGLLVIFSLCFYFYFNSQYFINIEARQGKIESNQLLGLVTISLYFLGSFILIGLIDKKRYFFAGFHFLLLVFLAVNFAGRVQILLVISIPFVYFFKSFRSFALTFTIIIIAIYPLILNGKTIIYTLFDDPYSLLDIGKYYTEKLNIDSMMNNLGHPLFSLYYADATVNAIGYRFFWDIIHGFLFYLSFFGLDVGKSLTYFNTETILFRKESIIPPGYLAFGYIQASYFGVFLMGIFFRLMGKIGEKMCTLSEKHSFSRDFFWAFLAANTFYSGEIRVLVLTYFLPVFIFMLYLKLNTQSKTVSVCPETNVSDIS